MTTKARLTPEEKARRKRERERAWRAANPDKVREMKRAWMAANPDKVKAMRQRAAARKREEHEEMRKAGVRILGNWSTGYGRGRPRVGEVREESPNAVAQAKYRKDNDQWREYNRIKQREWTQANPERRREIARAYYARKKERDAQNDVDDQT